MTSQTAEFAVRAIPKADDMTDGRGRQMFTGSESECEDYCDRNESPDSPDRLVVRVLDVRVLATHRLQGEPVHSLRPATSPWTGDTADWSRATRVDNGVTVIAPTYFYVKVTS